MPDTTQMPPLVDDPRRPAPRHSSPDLTRSAAFAGGFTGRSMLVGQTEAGVVLTDEATGACRYLLNGADPLAQRLAEVSVLVLSVIPDAAEWDAPTLHDRHAAPASRVQVTTISGDIHAFELPAARDILSVGRDQPTTTDADPVTIARDLREHIAFLVEVGALPHLATPPPGYNRRTAATAVLNSAAGAPTELHWESWGEAAPEAADDNARQMRYWTDQYVDRFTAELCAVGYPQWIASTAAHTAADRSADWREVAHATMNAVSGTATLKTLIGMAEHAKTLNHGHEPTAGTIARWELAAHLVATDPSIDNRRQAEQRAEILQMSTAGTSSGDIELAAAVHAWTFTAAGTTVSTAPSPPSPPRPAPRWSSRAERHRGR